MTRVAAIDCGTNSIRLLVADVDATGDRLVDVDRRMEVVRLGQGVDRTRRLAPQALDRTLAACRRYADVISGLGADRVRFVATSATRDAVNRADFTAGVLALLGVEPEVVTGAEEAHLSFLGATRELGGEGLGPYLVVDIGGGSTEFVLGDGRPSHSPPPGTPSPRLGADTVAASSSLASVWAARSVDVGCVRLTERHVRHDPPTAGEVAAVRADVAAGLEVAAHGVPLDRARTLVGVAGSVTTVAALALGLPRYDPVAIHRARIDAVDVRAVTARLLAMPAAARAALPVMHPGRVDVIAAGALVLEGVLDHTGLPAVTASEHDILDGIAWSLADS